MSLIAVSSGWVVCLDQVTPHTVRGCGLWFFSPHAQAAIWFYHKVTVMSTNRRETFTTHTSRKKKEDKNAAHYLSITDPSSSPPFKNVFWSHVKPDIMVQRLRVLNSVLPVTDTLTFNYIPSLPYTWMAVFIPSKHLYKKPNTETSVPPCKGKKSFIAPVVKLACNAVVVTYIELRFL